MESEHVFAGTVVSRGGGLAAGAEIAMTQESDERNALAGVARIPVGADGAFSVRMAPGRYVVMVQAPNHAPLVRKLSFDGDAPTSTAAFALTPAPRVRGRVVDDAGAPIADALVALRGGFDPKQRAASVRTEADGSFSLPVALGQDVVVTARGAGKVARAALGTAS